MLCEQCGEKRIATRTNRRFIAGDQVKLGGDDGLEHDGVVRQRRPAAERIGSSEQVGGTAARGEKHERD